MKIKNIKLLLTGGALAAFGALALQGCSSSDDSSGSAGSTSKGGSSSGGTSSSGGKGGTATTGGTSSGGKGGTGAAGTGTTGGSSTTTGGTGNAAGDTGNSAGDGNAAGDGAGGAGPTQAEQCTTFCADEGTICTFGAATAAPYTDSNACLAACNNFTLGDVGVYPDGPTSGDTFACRRWHLSKAGDTGPVATHCPHTGTLSKIAYADATATGPCAN